MPGYTIDVSKCCCGSPCCNLCCPGGYPQRLFAELQTDCGTYSAWLDLVEYPCCDADGQPIKCDGTLPQINGACKEYIGIIYYYECPQLIDANGDYACIGGADRCMRVTVSLLSGQPFACLTGNVRVETYYCTFPAAAIQGNWPLPQPVDCKAIDFSQDVSFTEDGGLQLACDYGTNHLTVTE